MGQWDCARMALHFSQNALQLLFPGERVLVVAWFTPTLSSPVVTGSYWTEHTGGGGDSN